MRSAPSHDPFSAVGWVLAAGLLLVVPLAFHRGFAEQFSYIKLVLAEGLVLLGLTIWALGLIWGKCRWPRRFPLGPPLTLLAAAVLLSCWNSPVPAFCLTEAQYFLCGPLWLLLLVSWGGGEARIRLLALLIAVAGSVVAAIALVQWLGHDPLLFGGYRIVWGTMVGRMRLYSTFGNPNFVAGYLIGAIFLTLGLAGTSPKLWRKAAWCASLAAIFAAIIGTRSRGAWAGLAAGLLLARLVWRGGSRQTALAPTAAAAGPSGMLVAVLVPAVAALVASPLMQTVESLATRLGGRFYLWRVSWPLFAEHPLFGHGWGTFQLRFLELQAQFLTSHPEYVRYWTHTRQLHNDPLQVLLEAGALGLVALGWLLWAYGREARQALAVASRSTRLWIGASAGGVTALLVNSLFNFQLAIPPTLLLLFTLLTFPHLLSSIENSGQRPGEVPPAGASAKPRRFQMLRVIASFAVVVLAAFELLQIGRRTAAEHDYMVAVDDERHGDIVRAEQAFREGLAHAPLDGRLHYGLARALYIKGRLPEALTEVLLAERTFADSHLEVLKARIQDQMGLATPALETYRHALALDPTLKSVRADIERLSK